MPTSHDPFAPHVTEDATREDLTPDAGDAALDVPPHDPPPPNDAPELSPNPPPTAETAPEEPVKPPRKKRAPRSRRKSTPSLAEALARLDGDA